MSSAAVNPPDDIETAETAEASGNGFEGEIREFVRRDFAPLRRSSEVHSAEFAAGNISSLVQRVAGTSLQEIDNLIGELQSVRDYIASEGERVQREIASYAQLNHAAMTSTRIISDSMAKWKDAVDDVKSA